MLAYVVSDAEFQTERFRSLEGALLEFLSEKGCSVERRSIERGELKSCAGCFGCWVKTPGECIVRDAIAEINRRSMQSDVTIYLCPIVFGQFSANMKNVIDRWLPNMLPFFLTRPDGSTMHPPRYDSYPAQVMIGYGDDLQAEDEALFCDITKKHRNGIEAMVWHNAEELGRTLGAMRFERIGGSL